MFIVVVLWTCCFLLDWIVVGQLMASVACVLNCCLVDAPLAVHAPSTCEPTIHRTKARRPGSGILSVQLNKQRDDKDSIGRRGKLVCFVVVVAVLFAAAVVSFGLLPINRDKVLT